MNKLLKSFGAFSVGPILGAVLGFLTIPLITYFISPEEYGRSSMFILAQGTISMLIFLGLDQAFVREFHSFTEKIDKLMTNTLIIPIILVFILDACIVINIDFVSILLFDVPTEHMAVYALALMLPFMIIENFSLLKIRMEEKGLFYSGFTISLKALTLIFTLLLIQFYEKSFRSVIWAISIAEIINGTTLFFFTMRNVRFKLSYLDKTLMKRMLKFGLPLLPASMLVWVLSSMDKVMLRTMCTYEELGLYSAAFKIVNILGVVQSCFTLFWTPVAYRWFQEHKEKKYFELVNIIVSFIMTEMCLGLLLCKDIVAFILGNDFSSAIYIFPFLVLHPIMYTMSEVTAVGIGFTRKTGYNILVSGISGGLNIILNYLLVPTMGGKGAAFATGISYIAFFWVRTFISGKLWYKFKTTPQLIYTVLIVINCLCHTFMTNWIPYVVSAISIVIIIFSNINILKQGLDLYREYNLRKKENREA